MTEEEEELKSVQLQEWPDSRILTTSEVLHEWLKVGQTKDELLSVAHSLAMCIQYKTLVFYECGMKDGKYQFRGARYGIQGHEYLSGFGKD